MQIENEDMLATSVSSSSSEGELPPISVMLNPTTAFPAINDDIPPPIEIDTESRPQVRSYYVSPTTEREEYWSRLKEENIPAGSVLPEALAGFESQSQALPSAPYFPCSSYMPLALKVFSLLVPLDSETSNLSFSLY